MIIIVIFSICLISSMIGGICGIGGGVIIKPVLDAAGIMDITKVSFLSGCTVLAMSIVTFLRNRKNKGVIDLKRITPLAIGAITGGVLGKRIFDLLKELFKNSTYLGAVQATLLIIITALTFVYTIKKSKIQSHDMNNSIICCLIGLTLGLISAFLGIGGGPINIMVLHFFFSMDSKKAAANSLYIIMLSQISSLFQSVVTHTIPVLNINILIIMIASGIIGGVLGGNINKKNSPKNVEELFLGAMGIIILINIYNFIKFIFI